ncbi:methyltransferase domain-containing protein [Natrarchaeobius chitinivorans]|uniref:Methyltransferase domain-containing protein n=1 Tax=Natrarchaeobius chitinivorans TaxID=1679083 RepID=A0A3N6LZP1_NATCH|nr:methyltransferase domain-containing protein [Natrarchaeobius chitinivorans]RQG93424.1 methyltransferase domain-containing protein [Natrarchaeobius chitinivorans]
MTDPSRASDRTETTITTSYTVPGAPAEVFETTIEELETSLHRRGFRFEPGPDGRIAEDGFDVGRVTVWEPGESIVLEWCGASWAPEELTELAVDFEELEDGTQVTVEHRGWGRLIDDSTDLVGWCADELVAPLLEATAPESFGDWLTDRQARTPAGEHARETYSEPLYHYPAFHLLLDELDLSPDDHLLEIGCGGGAFLELALEAGCHAAAVDHSREMVEVARRTNREAVDEGRLRVDEADAEALPFDDDTFTCATMAKVLGLLPDPAAALEELHRVLEPGGRIVVEGSDPELRGTVAAPEPLASRLEFYESDDLEGIARDAGFEEVEVVRRTLEPYAETVGVPEEHRSLFEYRARALRARKA